MTDTDIQTFLQVHSYHELFSKFQTTRYVEKEYN